MGAVHQRAIRKCALLARKSNQQNHAGKELARRSFASSTFNAPARGERLRIAIVGGGVAGLSTALHLADLVDRGLVASPIDVYVGKPNDTKSREIGVGVWSTALNPFQSSWTRPSHQMLWDDWMHAGRWLGEVGYTSPQGHWLAKSILPTWGSFTEFPGLLFLRERSLVEALQRAVHLESGTIKIHTGPKVTGMVEETNSKTWSAQLQLDNDTVTERDYHLIIGADGTHSQLRHRYGGHSTTRTRLTGTNVFSSPSSSCVSNSKRSKASTSWNAMGQAEANAIEDRNYSVLRGNSPLTNDDIGMDGVSFQTWGEGQSMRFATVPLSSPNRGADRIEEQVWFATTSDPDIVNEQNADKRKEKLLQAFSTWHKPIGTIMESTPADEIMMEGAVAHKHCVGPVLDVHRLLRELHRKAPPSAGPGPVMVFVGDSFMTVDPILAQGFTMALEGAHALVEPIELACQKRIYGTNDDRDDDADDPSDSLAFDPYALRSNLQQRHDRRNHRLVSLLRATEIVQALGQPQASLLGVVAKNVLRPAMRMTPNAIKAPIFNAMLKYSLGK